MFSMGYVSTIPWLREELGCNSISTDFLFRERYHTSKALAKRMRETEVSGGPNTLTIFSDGVSM